jgi:hypothetical protein
MSLRLDWATYESAKYAVENWHYSKVLPAGKIIPIGVWEDGQFVGVIIYSRGANNNIGKPFGLEQTEVCELTRVALRDHVSTVSRMISISLKMLLRKCPKIQLVVSYADPDQGHHGGVYQAGGWSYVGSSQAQREVMIDGQIVHKKSAWSLHSTIKGLQKGPRQWKHKYVMPTSNRMKHHIAAIAKPYPKRVKQAMTEHHSEQRQGSTDPHAPNFEKLTDARSQAAS